MGTFRQTYRELKPEEKQAVESIKDLAEGMETVIKMRPSREASLAMTKLEEAVMWAVKGITG